jgi:hypothetical protein
MLLCVRTTLTVDPDVDDISEVLALIEGEDQPTSVL